jgi:hypothetical protein
VHDTSTAPEPQIPRSSDTRRFGLTAPNAAANVRRIRFQLENVLGRVAVLVVTCPSCKHSGPTGLPLPAILVCGHCGARHCVEHGEPVHNRNAAREASAARAVRATPASKRFHAPYLQKTLNGVALNCV